MPFYYLRLFSIYISALACFNSFFFLKVWPKTVRVCFCLVDKQDDIRPDFMVDVSKIWETFCVFNNLDRNYWCIRLFSLLSITKCLEQIIKGVWEKESSGCRGGVQMHFFLWIFQRLLEYCCIGSWCFQQSEASKSCKGLFLFNKSGSYFAQTSKQALRSFLCQNGQAKSQDFTSHSQGSRISSSPMAQYYCFLVRCSPIPTYSAKIFLVFCIFLATSTGNRFLNAQYCFKSSIFFIP